MNAVDTNVLIYRFDFTEKDKQPLADALLARLAVERQMLLLWQAVGELLNQLSYWVHESRITTTDRKRYLDQMMAMFPLAMPSAACLARALELAEKHTLSHWDSMLIAACLEAGVTTLYTEDMGAPRKMETLELINPFSTSA